MVARGLMMMVSAAVLCACAVTTDNDQGRLQPQMVTGPCQVKKFFFLGFRSVPVEMTVANTGETCTMILVNSALNVVVNAALLTAPAQHGRSVAGVTSGGRQAYASYTPAPGFTGPDSFEVTLEPNAASLKVAVTVTPGR